MKIHIIGCVGSGKTTFARKIFELLALPHYELDNIVWERSNAGDTKRSVNERDMLLKDITDKNQWIIEEVHHKWVDTSLEEADVIDLVSFLEMYGEKYGIDNMNYVYDVITSNASAFRLWFEDNYQCGYRAKYTRIIDSETGEIK